MIGFYDKDLPTGREPKKIGPLKHRVPHNWVELSQKGGGEAVEDIANRSWRVAFFHVYQSQWTTLLNTGEMEGRVLVRVSSDGYAPATLERHEPLCLRLQPKLDHMCKEGFEAIARELLKPEVLLALREEGVPEKLVDYFTFVKPDYLAALWIAGVGALVADVMNEKAARTTNELSGELQKFLSGLGFAGADVPAQQAFADKLLGFLRARAGLRNVIAMEWGGSLPPEIEGIFDVGTGQIKGVIQQDKLTAALEQIGRRLHVY